MGIFSKFRKGFQRGAAALQGAFEKVALGKALNEDDLLAIEEALYESDFGVETTEEIMTGIRETHKKEKEFRGEDANLLAREVLRRTLDGSEGSFPGVSLDSPEVVCLIGVNGSGKRLPVQNSVIN